MRKGSPGRLEDGRVEDACSVDTKEGAERPAGVIVRTLLRILRRPELTIEQRVGDARVGLVHADDVTPSRERTRCGRFGFAGFRVIVFSVWGFGQLRQFYGDGRGGLLYLYMLIVQDAKQHGLTAGRRIVGGEHIRGGAVLRGLQDGALALEVVVVEEELRVLREVAERGEQRTLFVVVVVALRPENLRQRWIRLVPGALVLVRREDALDGIGAAVAEGFIEAADAIVHGGEEHEVAGTPG